jgi:hypothetical protein
MSGFTIKPMIPNRSRCVQEGEPAVDDDALDRPETDCADDHNAQDSDENRNNRNDIHSDYAL